MDSQVRTSLLSVLNACIYYFVKLYVHQDHPQWRIAIVDDLDGHTTLLYTHSAARVGISYLP